MRAGNGQVEGHHPASGHGRPPDRSVVVGDGRPCREERLVGEGARTNCAPMVYNMIHPSNILAVELYRGPGETPGEYLDSNARCGVILIWSRRGR